MEVVSKLYKGKTEVRFLGPTDDKPFRHMYFVDGVRKTGVTTYLGIIDKSRSLIIWATELYRDFLIENLKKGITEDHIYNGSTLHEEIKQKAASIGDEVHDWIEQYTRGEKPDMPDKREAQIGVSAFLDWEKENKVKFISSERVVYSKKHDYVGRLDIEAKVNGKLCLVDIKTSNSLYNTQGLQVAAYVKADEEESGKEYKGRWLIRLAKETEEEYIVRMNKKNQNRVRRGRDPVVIPSYRPFEARFLDEDKKNMDRDFKGFINAKELFEWNKKTDFFTNGNKK